MSMTNSIEATGNWTRDLSAYKAMPQSTAPPRTTVCKYFWPLSWSGQGINLSGDGILPEEISGKAARIGNSTINSNLTCGNLFNAELFSVDAAWGKLIWIGTNFQVFLFRVCCFESWCRYMFWWLSSFDSPLFLVSEEHTLKVPISTLS